mmetsp:Transcript_16434/g.36800  ORF Transcript_16434/g.36800 Transcript_16434/m.36800 type:complete len:231 (-) Transcript_16434:159-851(-)
MTRMPGHILPQLTAPPHERHLQYSSPSRPQRRDLVLHTPGPEHECRVGCCLNGVHLESKAVLALPRQPPHGVAVRRVVHCEDDLDLWTVEQNIINVPLHPRPAILVNAQLDRHVSRERPLVPLRALEAVYQPAHASPSHDCVDATRPARRYRSANATRRERIPGLRLQAQREPVELVPDDPELLRREAGLPVGEPARVLVPSPHRVVLPVLPLPAPPRPAGVLRARRESR